jgi:hypothetical protein
VTGRAELIELFGGWLVMCCSSVVTGRRLGAPDDADKAERLLRNLARRLDQEAPGVAASILEGLDGMLTVVRLKLPMPLRRSLACTNAIENMMGTVRRVSRNVKRWRNAAMALRWTAAGMLEAIKPHSIIHGDACLAFFNKIRGIPTGQEYSGSNELVRGYVSVWFHPRSRSGR